MYSVVVHANNVFVGTLNAGIWKRPVSQFTSVEVNPGGEMPESFSLGQNYPNPFNPGTTIRYALPTRSPVTLTVFNALGQKVALLQNGEQETGYHEIQFDGSGLSSGVYFYRLRAGEFVETKRLLLLR
jgi:hypothetical protein